jgi:hypothetical protein
MSCYHSARTQHKRLARLAAGWWGLLRFARTAIRWNRNSATARTTDRQYGKAVFELLVGQWTGQRNAHIRAGVAERPDLVLVRALDGDAGFLRSLAECAGQPGVGQGEPDERAVRIASHLGVGMAHREPFDLPFGPFGDDLATRERILAASPESTRRAAVSLSRKARRRSTGDARSRRGSACLWGRKPSRSAAPPRPIWKAVEVEGSFRRHRCNRRRRLVLEAAIDVVLDDPHIVRRAISTMRWRFSAEIVPSVGLFSVATSTSALGCCCAQTCSKFLRIDAVRRRFEPGDPPSGHRHGTRGRRIAQFLERDPVADRRYRCDGGHDAGMDAERRDHRAGIRRPAAVAQPLRFRPAARIGGTADIVDAGIAGSALAAMISPTSGPCPTFAAAVDVIGDRIASGRPVFPAAACAGSLGRRMADLVRPAAPYIGAAPDLAGYQAALPHDR